MDENTIANDEDFIKSLQPLTVGDTVPDIPFKIYYNGEISNSSIGAFRGKWLILFFYPADFTFVCPTELSEMADLYDEFQKEDVEIVSVSTDTAFTHKMWHETSDSIKKVKFPMASDHRREMIEMFNIMDKKDGLSYRATFIIDPDGVIRHFSINDNSFGRSGKEFLRMVRAAKFVNEHPGQVCPASWDAGDKTLTPNDDLVGKI